MSIIDYSTSRFTPAELKSAGVTAVGRYIGWDSVPGYHSIGKNVSKTEASTLLAGGIDLFLSFEYNANAPALGSGQGHLDGSLAGEQLKDLGAPPGMAVYFAVDFDMPDYAPSLADTPVNAKAKLGPVAQYFEAIVALHHTYAIGVYGGYFAVKRLFDAGLVHYGWQTLAWSGGKIDGRASLFQSGATPPFPGADINVHEGTGGYGSWNQAKATVTPPPPPATHPTLAQAEAALATLTAYVKG